MSEPTEFRVAVDPANPGQFFACCGLLELAARLHSGAEGCFAGTKEFVVAGAGGLAALVEAIAGAELTHTDRADPYSSPFVVGAPFRPLSVDWWATDRTGAKDLKVWAGTMESYGIAKAMQRAMRGERFRGPDLFDVAMVVQSADESGNKKEPFYFDSRRAPNAHSRDVGFSANDLGLTTLAHPAVEFLCVVGLQVARPAFTPESRVYDYFTWPAALPTSLVLAASCGAMDLPGRRGYRFENWFRTGQRKHKAFRSATPIPDGV